MDIAKAFDSVDRVKLFWILDRKITEQRERATLNKDESWLERLDLAEKAITPLKNIYDGHRLKTGD